jgi:hypothetical protein
MKRRHKPSHPPGGWLRALVQRWFGPRPPHSSPPDSVASPSAPLGNTGGTRPAEAGRYAHRPSAPNDVGADFSPPTAIRTSDAAQRGPLRFVKEHRVNPAYAAQFERAYAADGAYGRMFVANGCELYLLLRSRTDARSYIVVHTWRDWESYSRAQERAAQESYGFQQLSREWVFAVHDVDDSLIATADGIREDAYEVLSSTR